MTAAAAAAPACVRKRTAYACGSFFLFFNYIYDCRSHNFSKDHYHHKICHFATSYYIVNSDYAAFLFNAYSAARVLSVFFIKYTTAPAMAATAINPGRKPAPKLPVVINVPI